MTNSKEKHRAIFHSSNDLSVGYHLQNAEIVLNKLEESGLNDINDYMHIWKDTTISSGI